MHHGLGLATAASILRAGGGHIQLSSGPRIGTTVELLIPAADQPVPVPAREDPPAAGHILVVEDKPELAHLLRHLLEPAGYRVTVATERHPGIRVVYTSGYAPAVLGAIRSLTVPEE